MIYTFDTEFWERDFSHPVELISLGIVAEDGRTYYAVNADFDWSRVPSNHWLIENVQRQLTSTRENTKRRGQIRADLLRFFHEDRSPEFWAYFADYDWVLFCQIFGTMLTLPPGFPHLCYDIRQMRKHLGLSRDVFPVQKTGEHNALSDARWNMECLKILQAHEKAQQALLSRGISITRQVRPVSSILNL